MNRQLYSTHMYLFNSCGCEQKKVFEASIIISVALLLFIFMFHTNPAKKGCACNAAFNTHACVHVVLIIFIRIKRNRLV